MSKFWANLLLCTWGELRDAEIYSMEAVAKETQQTTFPNIPVQVHKKC